MPVLRRDRGSGDVAAREDALMTSSLMTKWRAYRRRQRHAVVLKVWPEGSPRERMNEGAGCCNTGSGFYGICALGGIGCDIDHAKIARRTGASLAAALGRSCHSTAETL
jgi:hypothetical protein